MKLKVPDYVKDIRANCTSIDDAVESILTENNITKPPIDVMKIADSMDISIFNARFKDEKIVGIIADLENPIPPFNKKRFITVDSNSYPTRRWFTIAHEIGHFVMHCSDKNDYFERDHYEDELSDNRDSIEKAADNFAACLLLPKAMFVKFVMNSFAYETGNWAQLVAEIQKEFLVSYKTALLRLKSEFILLI